MILAIECVAACLIFGAAIVGSTLMNKTAWLHEYAPEVQQRFLEKNPDFTPPKKSGLTFPLVCVKLAVCAVFVAILSVMVRLAGAKDFFTGTLYGYIIWTVVNIFDVFALDIGVFAHWKRVRLPGTEDMDKEYASNAKKSLIDGIYGVFIGIPAALACGAIISLIV